MVMFLEILLGVAGGYFLQPLYYEFIFVPYPETRLALFSIVPPLVLTAVLAWVADTLWQFTVGIRNPLRRQGAFWNHAIGASLFFSAFLHIEAAKIGTELRLPYLATPPVVAIGAALLAWCWVRACHYRLMMAHLPELLPSMQIAEIAMRVSGKSSEKSASSATRSGQDSSGRKGLFGKRSSAPQASAEKRPRNDESLKAVRGAFEQQLSGKKPGKPSSPSIFRAMK